jgi:hypothetical protein
MDIISHTLFSRGEIQWCRKKVTEISHFLDIQKEEFEDLQNLLLNAVASLAPSEEASGEMEEISDNEMTAPEPPQENGEDNVPADRVPSDNTTTVIAHVDRVPSEITTIDIAPADCAPSDTTTIEIALTDCVQPENTTTVIALAHCVPSDTTTIDIGPNCVPPENTTTVIAPTDRVPSEITTTDTTPADCVPPENTTRHCIC